MPAALVVCVLGLSVVCLAAFVHPYLTYPLSLRLFRERPVETRPPQSPASFSLLFCAYNESAIVAAKLANLRELKAARQDLEILAYDDSSTDGTFEALSAEPDLLRVVPGAGRTGKAHGMKVLAGQARGDLLVFTDANVMLDPDALRAFAETYSDATVGGICGTLLYSASDEGTSTETVGGLYWRLEEVIKSLESRTGNVMGADGSIFSVRREVYPDFPDTVQDDFTVSMSAVFAGRRLVRRQDAKAYEAQVSSSREEFRRKVRIAARAYHTHLHLRRCVKQLGALDRYKYVSHKLLRWHSATFLCLGIVALAVVVAGAFGLAVLGLCVGVVAVLAGLGAVLVPRVAGNVTEILLAIFATNWGVWQALRGRTFATWQPPPR
jgi:cellulose synthase/poly-beta-1,6-N-acetylglucosamine synthase-like glycosyltransferase